MAGPLAEQLLQRSVASLAKVVHVPKFFSPADVALVRRLRGLHHERLGAPPPARAGWDTTYLSAGGLFRAAAPELHRRLGDLRHEVDLSPFDWAGGAPAARELLGSLEPRCIEMHTGKP